MKTATTFLIAMLSLWAFSSCHAGDQKLDRAVAQMSASVDAFATAKHRYPRTLRELQAFAAATTPLDLRFFTKVDFQFHGAGSLSIDLYTTLPDLPARMLRFDRTVYP